jgi:hypothetical protein
MGTIPRIAMTVRTRQALPQAELLIIAKNRSTKLLNLPMIKVANLLNQWFTTPFGYQEYEADKKRRLGEEGAKPKRIRYKPISR